MCIAYTTYIYVCMYVYIAYNTTVGSSNSPLEWANLLLLYTVVHQHLLACHTRVVSQDRLKLTIKKIRKHSNE